MDSNSITNIKSRFIREILSDFIIVIVSVVALLMIFVNTGTIIFFGIGDYLTNVKELLVSVVIAVIFIKMGLGRKVETSVKLDDAKENFIINIIGKKMNKEYKLSPSDIKCIHQLKSKDVTLIFYVKQPNKIIKKQKYKVYIDGKDIGNPSGLLNTLKKYNVDIKTYNDEGTKTS